jgi:hypothetical protein
LLSNINVFLFSVQSPTFKNYSHFSRLLRHAWVTVGLFLFPGHHTGVTGVKEEHVPIKRFQKHEYRSCAVCSHFIITHVIQFQTTQW